MPKELVAQSLRPGDLLKRAFVQSEGARHIGVPETTRMLQRGWAEISQRDLLPSERERLARAYGAEILCIFNHLKGLYIGVIDEHEKQRQAPGGRDLSEIKVGDELELGVGKITLTSGKDGEFPTISINCVSRREDIKIRGVFVVAENGMVASGINMDCVLKSETQPEEQCPEAVEQYTVNVDNGKLVWMQRWRSSPKGVRRKRTAFLKVD
jgi:hypothetical protein